MIFYTKCRMDKISKREKKIINLIRSDSRLEVLVYKIIYRFYSEDLLASFEPYKMPMKAVFFIDNR